MTTSAMGSSMSGSRMSSSAPSRTTQRSRWSGKSISSCRALREALNRALKKQWQEWEIPRQADSSWAASVRELHTDWWEARVSRQKEINASIAAKAENEFLFDKPYEDKGRSVSPARSPSRASTS